MRLTSADFISVLVDYDLEIVRLEEALAHLRAEGRRDDVRTVALILARTRQDIELRRPWIEALLRRALDSEGEAYGRPT